MIYPREAAFRKSNGRIPLKLLRDTWVQLDGQWFTSNILTKLDLCFVANFEKQSYIPIYNQWSFRKMDTKRGGLLALLVVVVIGIIGAILGFILGFHKADDPGIVCIKREMGDTT